jgi:uncharacterized membrane protein
MKPIILLIIGFFLTVNIFSQKADTTEFREVELDKVDQSYYENSANKQIQELKPISSWEFGLSLVVLAFGMIVILLEVFLIMKKKIGAENTVKFIVVTLIITSTLFLITAGYDNNQIAPAMGLLGTIAGYLLGNQKNEKDKKDDKS